MEIFGGFMVMLSIIGFFLTIIWLAVPFVIFAIKGRVDRIVVMLEEIDRRLKALEENTAANMQNSAGTTETTAVPPGTPPSLSPPPAPEE